MTKSVKMLLLLAVLLLLAGIAGTWYVMQPARGKLVEIVQDGKVLYTIDLAAAQNREILITAPDGSRNLVRIEDGTIFMADADCPDHTCVKMGVLVSEELPIVCLPNRVIIRFQKGKL